MEAFLLTLDVISIILLCIGIKRVTNSKDPKDLGLFAYAEKKIDKNKLTKKGSASAHA